MKVRVKAVSYFEIEIDQYMLDENLNLADHARDTEVWPRNASDGDIEGIQVWIGHSWEDIDPHYEMKGWKERFARQEFGPQGYRVLADPENRIFKTEDEAIRTFLEREKKEKEL